jgi:RNA polymerase sigma factor (sigma-70 family)
MESITRAAKQDIRISSLREQAARKIFDYLYPLAVRLAARHLQQYITVDDPEDVAARALYGLLLNLVAGADSCGWVSNREDLRKMLSLAVRSRASNAIRDAHALYHNAQRTVSLSAERGLEHASPVPSPDLAASAREECERLLALLPEEHRTVLLLMLKGFTQEEIAKLLGVSVRTVQRRLEGVRDVWKEHGAG